MPPFLPVQKLFNHLWLIFENNSEEGSVMRPVLQIHRPQVS